MTDAFWVAFRVPNMLRRMFAEGCIQSGLCTRSGCQQGSVMARLQRMRLIDSVATLLTHDLGGDLLWLGMVGAPVLGLPAG
jgi:hypothetical protein